MFSINDLVVCWRDFFVLLTWITGIAFLIGGTQDLLYDVGHYVWRIFKRRKYGKRMRLNLTLLRTVAQQQIAVFVPAWDEANVIESMVEKLIQQTDISAMCSSSASIRTT